MMLLYRIGFAAFVLVTTFSSGFFYGRSFEKSNLYEITLSAHQNAGDIRNEINNLDDYNLCVASHGLPDKCQVFMRGLAKAAESK